MFKISSKFKPTGDQPEAIEKLTGGFKKNLEHQTLLGVTGSGKTFTMANVISNLQKPTLIVSHNKTLAAQLYHEFKEFFPDNSVHYFVSYYDYYQPEAYIPHSDTYIEKDAKINEEIDKLRHAATQALLTRDDVIVVASVSCIYNLGSPEEYKKLDLKLYEGQKISASKLAQTLIRLQYIQDIELGRGKFRKTKDEFEIIPATGNEIVKVAVSKNQIKKISIARDIDLEKLSETEPEFKQIIEMDIFPAKYWIMDSTEKTLVALENIKSELEQHIQKLKDRRQAVEAHRLFERTMYDIQMIKETGYCHGIENYSRHLDFRKEGDPPYTMLDFFKTKGEFLTIIDESHITVPQIRGMYNGDRSRKQTLVKHGFRLPSALDNRPLTFPEFGKRTQDTMYVSATPGNYELEKIRKEGLTEQFIRPTGLLDPTIEIVPTENQIDHLMEGIRDRMEKKERVLITTLTKRMAEDLSEYLAQEDIKVNYIHSEIKTLERLEILRDLRLGKYDVVVGVNLLREGLDLPEVSLIAIMDADKQGFLRNTTTLIQTMGRAARNINGHVIMYADKTTSAMQEAIDEIDRRRKIQEDYNQKHGITPKTIIKEIKASDLPLPSGKAISVQRPQKASVPQLEKEIKKAVKNLDFEKALLLRDQIRKLQGKD
jgi:excinuclease ABC subunit B